MADWEAFSRHLALAAERSFDLGTWDCLIFADGAQRALHGQGFAGDWLGGYLTRTGRPRSGRTLARKYGLATIEAALDARLRRVVGQPPRGAVALRPGGPYLGFSLGVVTGVGVAFLAHPRGLLQRPLAECTGFWNR